MGLVEAGGLGERPEDVLFGPRQGTPLWELDVWYIVVMVRR